MSTAGQPRWVSFPSQGLTGGGRLLGVEERGQRVIVLISLAEVHAEDHGWRALQLHDAVSGDPMRLRWMHRGGSGTEYLLTLVFEGPHGEVLRLLSPEGGSKVVIDLGAGDASQ